MNNPINVTVILHHKTQDTTKCDLKVKCFTTSNSTCKHEPMSEVGVTVIHYFPYANTVKVNDLLTSHVGWKVTEHSLLLQMVMI